MFNYSQLPQSSNPSLVTKKTEFFLGDGRTPLGTLPQTLTDSIDTTKGPNVDAAIFFRPFPDGSNYRCSVTYKLTNGVKESENAYTLTFTITPENDAPRIVDTVDRIVVPENTKVDTIVKFVDPEGQKVTVSVAACGGNRGTFVVGGVTIDCTTAVPSGNTPIPVGDDGSVTVSFTGPADTFGSNFNSITFKVSDGQADATVTLPVDVVPLNNNPTIFIGEQIQGKGLITQEISVSDGSAKVGEEFSLYKNIFVEDFECQNVELMEVEVTFTAGEIIFSKKQFTVISDASSHFFEGTASEINLLLNSLTWKSTEDVTDGTVTITVSDKGYFGKCLTNGVYQDSCVLKATLIAHVSAGRDAAVTNVAAIAGPTVAVAATVAAAGVAAGIGLIGAGSSSSVAATAGFDAAFATGAAQTSGIFQGAATGGSSAIFV